MHPETQSVAVRIRNVSRLTLNADIHSPCGVDLVLGGNLYDKTHLMILQIVGQKDSMDAMT